jgi:hypothetical protein
MKAAMQNQQKQAYDNGLTDKLAADVGKPMATSLPKALKGPYVESGKSTAVKATKKDMLGGDTLSMEDAQKLTEKAEKVKRASTDVTGLADALMGKAAVGASPTKITGHIEEAVNRAPPTASPHRPRKAPALPNRPTTAEKPSKPKRPEPDKKKEGAAKLANALMGYGHGGYGMASPMSPMSPQPGYGHGAEEPTPEADASLGLLGMDLGELVNSPESIDACIAELEALRALQAAQQARASSQQMPAAEDEMPKKADSLRGGATADWVMTAQDEQDARRLMREDFEAGLKLKEKRKAQDQQQVKKPAAPKKPKEKKAEQLLGKQPNVLAKAYEKVHKGSKGKDAPKPGYGSCGSEKKAFLPWYVVPSLGAAYGGLTADKDAVMSGLGGGAGAMTGEYLGLLGGAGLGAAGASGLTRALTAGLPGSGLLSAGAGMLGTIPGAIAGGLGGGFLGAHLGSTLGERVSEELRSPKTASTRPSKMSPEELEQMAKEAFGLKELGALGTGLAGTGAASALMAAGAPAALPALAMTAGAYPAIRGFAKSLFRGSGPVSQAISEAAPAAAKEVGEAAMSGVSPMWKYLAIPALGYGAYKYMTTPDQPQRMQQPQMTLSFPKAGSDKEYEEMVRSGKFAELTKEALGLSDMALPAAAGLAGAGTLGMMGPAAPMALPIAGGLGTIGLLDLIRRKQLEQQMAQQQQTAVPGMTLKMGAAQPVDEGASPKPKPAPAKPQMKPQLGAGLGDQSQAPAAAAARSLMQWGMGPGKQVNPESLLLDPDVQELKGLDRQMAGLSHQQEVADWNKLQQLEGQAAGVMPAAEQAAGQAVGAGMDAARAGLQGRQADLARAQEGLNAFRTQQAAVEQGLRDQQAAVEQGLGDAEMQRFLARVNRLGARGEADQALAQAKRQLGSELDAAMNPGGGRPSAIEALQGYERRSPAMSEAQRRRAIEHLTKYYVPEGMADRAGGRLPDMLRQRLSGAGLEGYLPFIGQ